MACINCGQTYFCLDNVSIFSSLNSEEKMKIHKLVEHRFFKAGETIYLPGMPASSLYIVSNGKIRIYRLSESGKEQLLRIVTLGEFTGELALFKKGYYEAFAEALEDTHICTISHLDFKNLLFKFPNIATSMLSVLANRLSYSEEQTAWVSTLTVRERIVHYLTKTSYSDKDDLLVKLKMPKKDLASYLGTTPESLSREFTKLEDENVITFLKNDTYKLNHFKPEVISCKII